MVAYISGSPNPVIFKYSDVVLHHQLHVHVGWDTGDPAVKAWVWRSVDGGAEKRLPGAAAPTGSVDPDPQIALDQVLTFVLRRSTNMQEIGRTTVVTEKNALATAMTDPDLDFIFALKVDPLVDSIHVAFRTKQPAVAYVEIRRQDSGELVDLRMGSSFGQQHDNVFSGFGNGLAQDTAFDMRIVALKDIGGGRVALGSGAKNPEIKGSVTTGARTVTVLFDLIHVRNDGDPAGAGEFTFLFGVGDVDTQLRLGTAPSWGEGDISSGGDREVARTVTIEHAPRRMWAQVVAWEDDTSVGDLLGHPLGLGFAFPSGPGFAPAGSDSYEVAEGSAAWVTMHFDIEQIATDRQAGFEMSTKDFTISYDVFGSITVRRRNGVNNFKGLALGRVKHQPPQISHPIRVHSRTLPVGKTQQVALSSGVSQLSISPDGSVLLRRSDPLARAGFVADLGGCFHDSVTVVAPPRELEPRDGGRPPASGDTVHVLGITHEGQVVVRTLTGESTGVQWCPLGGTFTGDVTAAVRGELVDVLAHDAQGHLFHRTLSAHGHECDGSHSGEWMRLGGGLAGPLAATGTVGSELALFALADDGRILHKRLDAAGRWSPEEQSWDELGRVGEGVAASMSLAVQWVSELDLIVSVFDGDDLAGALLWRGYPRPDSETEWVPMLAEPTVASTGCEC